MIRFNKEKKLNAWVKGSYTVELSFLLPIILVLIFLIIYMIFYEHDNVKCEAILYEQARWKEQEFLTDRYWNYENEIKVKNQENNTYKNGFFLIKLQNHKSSNNMFSVRESISMDNICSNPYIKTLIKEIGITNKNEVEVLLYNPSEVLRVYDGISECFDSEGSWDFKNKQLKKIKQIYY